MTVPVEFFQLAKEWQGDEPPYPGLMAETKIDGFRAGYWRSIDGDARLWCRKGYPIEATGHIQHRLRLMEKVAGEPMFFDGEFQVGGLLSATKRHFERDYKFGIDAGTFFVFDCLTEEEWKSNKCDRPLVERKAMLERLYKESLEQDDDWEWREGSRGKEPEEPAVVVMADEWVSSVDEIMNLVWRVWSAKGEGLIVKDAEAPYRRGRSNIWQKVIHPHYVPGVGLERRSW